MASLPLRLKPIIGIDKDEVRSVYGALHRLEPLTAPDQSILDRPIHGDLFAGEYGTGQEVGGFQCPHIPSARRDHLFEGVEKLRIEVPPLVRMPEVADVPAILVVGLIWIEPPSHAEAISRHQLSQNADLYEVTDVTHVSILHGVRSPTRL